MHSGGEAIKPRSHHRLNQYLVWQHISRCIYTAPMISGSATTGSIAPALNSPPLKPHVWPATPSTPLPSPHLSPYPPFSAPQPLSLQNPSLTSSASIARSPIILEGRGSWEVICFHCPSQSKTHPDPYTSNSTLDVLQRRRIPCLATRTGDVGRFCISAGSLSRQKTTACLQNPDNRFGFRPQHSSLAIAPDEWILIHLTGHDRCKMHRILREYTRIHLVGCDGGSREVGSLREKMRWDWRCCTAEIAGFTCVAVG